VTARLADPATGSSFVEGCLPGEIAVPLHPPTTFYARYGDAFAIGLLILCIGVAGLQARRHRRD
jgi:apolipoprotein N-acyltransferase